MSEKWDANEYGEKVLKDHVIITVQFEGYPKFICIRYAGYLHEPGGVVNLPIKGELWDLQELKENENLAEILSLVFNDVAKDIQDGLPKKMGE